MKRLNNLHNKISLKNTIYIYQTQIRRNTKNKVKIYNFENYYSINICRSNELLNTKYYPGKYNIFIIKEPKYRLIMSQNIKDKLVNHVVANILIDVLEPSLIDTNVATRKNKGTHYGIKYVKKYLNMLKKGDVYVLKFDISKYFYSINHEILKKLYRKKIKDKKFLYLLDEIIDSTDAKYVNKEILHMINNEINFIKKLKISEKEKQKKIKELKQIPLYKKGKGLPIGNMTSQILAIYYLNELDHFIKEKLKVKYIRYMDDGILFSNSKKYLQYCLDEITLMLNNYDLKLNKKTKIINVKKEGLDFLGFRFYILNNKVIMKVRNDTKKRFKRKMKFIKKHNFSFEYFQIINSYNSHLKWGNCHNLLIKYTKH